MECRILIIFSWSSFSGLKLIFLTLISIIMNAQCFVYKVPWVKLNIFPRKFHLECRKEEDKKISKDFHCSTGNFVYHGQYLNQRKISDSSRYNLHYNTVTERRKQRSPLFLKRNAFSSILFKCCKNLIFS